MAIVNPPIFINDYLKQKLNDIVDLDVPFFPTSPSTIDQLTQSFPNLNNSAGLFAVYDRMLKMRRGPFPHKKNEQILYYFYGTAAEAIPKLLDATQVVSDLLDREDESAQELNAWISNNPRLFVGSDGKKVYQPKNDTNIYIDPENVPSGINPEKAKSFLPVYFHYFRIYQLEETRDIIDFGTARTYAGNKIIIDYCYHSVGEKYRADGKLTYNNTVIN
jgi:hypothetical protein